MATLTKQRTEQAPRLEDHAAFRATHEAMTAANRELALVEERLAAAWRDRQATDELRRLDAEERFPRLDVEARRARATVEAAKQAHAAARLDAQAVVNRWHVEHIKRAVPPMLEDLARFQAGPYAEVRRRVEAAVAAGLVPSVLPAPELALALAFGRVGGDVFVERCASRLRRWLDE